MPINWQKSLTLVKLDISSTTKICFSVLALDVWTREITLSDEKHSVQITSLAACGEVHIPGK